ncbi:MAG TPA: hypothetical protein PKC18_20840, partial [Lacipirellulaceae bacterium]|nr:hypothetical protein [Lacipirellulaceae bacterium]
GDEDRFGIVDLEWLPTIPRNAARGLVTGFGVHWLDGPASTDMPPRLYDFTLGYHWRERLSPTLALDLAFRVGAFSDFESSARKGVRYPSHAVVYGRLDPAWELALGVDVLDRDDISLLPVVGAIWTPGPNLRVDALFPRPRAAVRLAEDVPWIYIRGELGGGTWAIQRVDQSRDNATYRDLRLAGGLEFDLGHGASSSFEVAYVFARELSYRSGVGDYQPGDTIMLSLIGAY